MPVGEEMRLERVNRAALRHATTGVTAFLMSVERALAADAGPLALGLGYAS